MPYLCILGQVGGFHIVFMHRCCHIELQVMLFGSAVDVVVSSNHSQSILIPLRRYYYMCETEPLKARAVMCNVCHLMRPDQQLWLRHMCRHNHRVLQPAWEMHVSTSTSWQLTSETKMATWCKVSVNRFSQTHPRLVLVNRQHLQQSFVLFLSEFKSSRPNRESAK